MFYYNIYNLILLVITCRDRYVFGLEDYNAKVVDDLETLFTFTLELCNIPTKKKSKTTLKPLKVLTKEIAKAPAKVWRKKKVVVL